jgi:uncharacterized protein YndB with AHSA1/START domain
MNRISTELMLPDIVASTYIDASQQRVYGCLTTAEGWNSWFTKETTVDLRPGRTIRLVWKNWGVLHTDLEECCKIIEVEPNERFSFNWQTDNPLAKVTFMLEKHGAGTLLTVTESGYKAAKLDRFLECAIGWGEAITLLKFYLEHGAIYGQVPK